MAMATSPEFCQVEPVNDKLVGETCIEEIDSDLAHDIPSQPYELLKLLKERESNSIKERRALNYTLPEEQPWRRPSPPISRVSTSSEHEGGTWTSSRPQSILTPSSSVDSSSASIPCRRSDSFFKESTSETCADVQKTIPSFGQAGTISSTEIPEVPKIPQAVAKPQPHGWKDAQQMVTDRQPASHGHDELPIKSTISTLNKVPVSQPPKSSEVCSPSCDKSREYPSPTSGTIQTPKDVPEYELSMSKRAYSFSSTPTSALKSIQKAPSLLVRAFTFPEPTKSLPLDYQTVAIDDKYFVSTDMPVPAEARTLWQESLKPLLEDTLCRSARATRDSDAALALELYMAGTSRTKLRAAILITCCSSKRKKQLKRVLEDVKWLKDCGLPHIIRIDKSFGHRSAGSHVTHPLIEANLRPKFSTLCGIAAKVRNSEEDGDKAVKFTIGGLIRVGDRFAYLTAGHPFCPSMADEEDSSTDEYSDSTGSMFDDSDGYFMESTSEDETNLENGDYRETTLGGLSVKGTSKPQHCKDAHGISYKPFLHGGLVSHFESPYFTRRLENPYLSKSTGMDWALFLTTKYPSLLLPNSVWFPGEDLPTQIDSFVPRQDLDSGEVWVATGHGLKKGIVHTISASIYLWGSFREVRQISLDRPIEHGDSGSWVLRNKRLCGYIVAGRDFVPWAYMVLIDDIFQDIHAYFPNAISISLPSSEQVASFRTTLEQVLEGKNEIKSDTSSLTELPMGEKIENEIYPFGIDMSSKVTEITSANVRRPYNLGPTTDEKAQRFPQTTNGTPTHKYLSDWRQWLVTGALMISMFLANDSGISTAVPAIIDDLKSMGDMGLYYSSYLLARAFGQLAFSWLNAKYYPNRNFLVALVLIIMSSPAVTSTVARNEGASTFLIIVRAVKGLGSAGIVSCYPDILDNCVPPSQRLRKQYFVNFSISLSLVVNPVIAGILTDSFNWRWSIYVDVLYAVLPFLIISCLGNACRPAHPMRITIKIWHYMSIGLFIAGAVSLTLLLNWVGLEHALGSTSIHILLGLSAGLGITSIFCISLLLRNTYRGTDSAMLFLNTSSPAGLFSMTLCSIFLNSGFQISVYFLPMWFQAVKNASPSVSGAMIQACILTFVLSGLLGYTPFVAGRKMASSSLLLSTTLASLGAAFMSWVTAEAEVGSSVGGQIVFGIGAGMGCGVTFVRIRTALSASRYRTMSLGMIAFSEDISSAVLVSAAQSIFAHSILAGRMKIEGISKSDILNNGLFSAVSAGHQHRNEILHIYNKSFINVLYLVVGLVAFSVVGVAMLAWPSTKEIAWLDRGLETDAFQASDNDENHGVIVPVSPNEMAEARNVGTA